MQARQLLAMGVAVLVAGGCAHGGSTPAKEFTPVGTLRLGARTVSFSDNRVVSPQMDIVRSGDSAWTGLFHNQVVDVSVYPNRMAGVNLTVKREVVGNVTKLKVLWTGKLIRYEVSPERIVIDAPGNAAVLVRQSPGVYGPMGELVLTGKAVSLDMPLPVLTFALLAVADDSIGEGNPGRGQVRMP